jgi:hypothetical protein
MQGVLADGRAKLTMSDVPHTDDDNQLTAWDPAEMYTIADHWDLTVCGRRLTL